MDFNCGLPLVTRNDKGVILKQDKETLRKWHRMINVWQWPAELAGHPCGEWIYKPRKIKIFGIVFWRSRIIDTRESQIKEYIRRLIGEESAVTKLMRMKEINIERTD